MNPYGIEFFIQARQRQLNLEREQQRLWEAARREARAAAVAARPHRSRVTVGGALRRLVQFAWAW